MSLTIKINGGGIHSQAEAVRHGVSRALILFKEELKDVLKTSGHLTRDSRMRERKKPGLRRARKSAQWSKR
jgi:small subunit ribosomal protein S9